MLIKLLNWITGTGPTGAKSPQWARIDGDGYISRKIKGWGRVSVCARFMKGDYSHMIGDNAFKCLAHMAREESHDDDQPDADKDGHGKDDVKNIMSAMKSLKKTLGLQRGQILEAKKKGSKPVYEHKVVVEDGFDKHVMAQCEGRGPDLLRDFKGTAQECMDKCTDFGAKCTAVVRTNLAKDAWKAQNGKCYFRGGGLKTYKDGSTFEDVRSWATSADCFVQDQLSSYLEQHSNTTDSGSGSDIIPDKGGTPYKHKIINEEDFDVHVQTQCMGKAKDLLRDFKGSLDECKAKCKAFGPKCTSFVRIKGESAATLLAAKKNGGKGVDFAAGKCYFRSGGIRGVFENPMLDRWELSRDYRDCFVQVIKKNGPGIGKDLSAVRGLFAGIAYFAPMMMLPPIVLCVYHTLIFSLLLALCEACLKAAVDFGMAAAGAAIAASPAASLMLNQTGL